MTLKPLIITVLLSCLMSTIAVLVYHRFYEKKMAYIDIKKVFDGFQMKADLEIKYKEIEKNRNKILDSLAFNLKIMSKHFNEAENRSSITKSEAQQFEYRREEYVKLRDQYREENAALSQKYDHQILTRLTQYMIEYGKKHHYNMIFGADGNGTLMYANEANNISEDVIVYINNNYKGVD